MSDGSAAAQQGGPESVKYRFGPTYFLTPRLTSLRSRRSQYTVVVTSNGMKQNTITEGAENSIFSCSVAYWCEVSFVGLDKKRSSATRRKEFLR